MTEEGKIMMKSYLSHHGIQGQHWGVKNGPPYPLKPEVSQRIQKKGKADAEYRKKRDELKKGSTKVKTEGFSEDENLNTKPVTNSRELSRMAHQANEGRFGQEGYCNNCAKCSTALELIKRGYDVKAGPSIYGNLTSASDYWWDGATTYNENTYRVQNRINSFGRNGSGTVGIRYKSGGGHSFNFFNVGGYNNTMFVNSQTGDVIGTWNDVLDFFPAIDTNARVRVTRLDEATPNFKHMEEDKVLEWRS